MFNFNTGMNPLIWISENALEKEEDLVNSLESKIAITGAYCGGDYETKPITFRNTSLIINWSYTNLRLDFYFSSEELNAVTTYYFYLIYYGEWGEILEKPIIFMEIETLTNLKKSKKPLSVSALLELSGEKKIRLSIYFEPTIQGDPLQKEYCLGNNSWIAYLGGLYYSADLSLWIEDIKTGAEISYQEPCDLKIVNDAEYKIENWKTLIDLAYETALTAKELKRRNVTCFDFRF